MNMSHLKMHHDHVKWTEENKLFRDEIAIWQKNIDSIFQAIQEQNETILKYSSILKDHLVRIVVENQGSRNHEKAMAGFEKCESSNDQHLMELDKIHEAYEAKRRKLVQNHMDLKSQHQQVMTNWSRFLKALTQKKRLRRPDKSAGKLP